VRSRVAFGRPAALLLLGLLALLVPALLNGFPLVFADTGGYLARPFERTLALGRSAFYGLFLAAGIPFDFWPNILLQAVLTVWLIRIVLREMGRAEWGAFVLIIVALAVLTSLPWYAGQLMPDIFVPLAVIAFHLLAFEREGLRKYEAILLGAVIAAGVASHMSILGLVVALLLFAFAILLLQRWVDLPPPRLIGPLAAVISGILLALCSNFVIAGKFAFTPGGSTFLFGRLLQDGIVGRYLDDHCPDPDLRLCAFRAELPANADDWLWGNGPLSKLGGWEEFEPEARQIILRSIMDYPGAHIQSALRATVEQLTTVATGEGMHSRDNWHAEAMLKKFAPDTFASFMASRQQHDGFDFGAINLFQVPLALLAMAMLPVWILLFRRSEPRISCFAGSALFAILTNAAICGIFSNPNARYQSRIAPLAVLAALVALLEFWRAWKRKDVGRVSVARAAHDL
jgi:hypothetical protein